MVRTVARAPATTKSRVLGRVSKQAIDDGIAQYSRVLPTTDPKSIAIQLAVWQADHTQYAANCRVVDALDLPVSFTGHRLLLLRTLYFAPSHRMTLGGLSKATGLSPVAITNYVDSLIRGSLVRRCGSTEDRRVNYAQLTEKGEAAFLSILPELGRRWTEAGACFTEEEKDTLLQLLQRLC